MNTDNTYFFSHREHGMREEQDSNAIDMYAISPSCNGHPGVIISHMISSTVCDHVGLLGHVFLFYHTPHCTRGWVHTYSPRFTPHHTLTHKLPYFLLLLFSLFLHIHFLFIHFHIQQAGTQEWQERRKNRERSQRDPTGDQCRD